MSADELNSIRERHRQLTFLRREVEDWVYNMVRGVLNFYFALKIWLLNL